MCLCLIDVDVDVDVSACCPCSRICQRCRSLVALFPPSGEIRVGDEAADNSVDPKFLDADKAIVAKVSKGIEAPGIYDIIVEIDGNQLSSPS